MKTLLTCVASLLFLGVGASAARAQYPFPVRPLPVYCPAQPLTAPDMTGPGFYVANCWGQYFGPSYCVQPPFPPFQGVLPMCQGSPAQQVMQMQQMQMMQQMGGGGCCPLLSHPFTRSPRDFFMVD